MESNNCKKLIKVMERAYQTVRTPDEVEKWIKFGSQNIRLLNKLLRKRVITVGEKWKIQTLISQLQSLSIQFKNKLKRGAGSARKLIDRVKWVDTESAFQGRIRTGTIVNLQHLDLPSFLEDAKKITNVRLRNILHNQGGLKVNGVLGCKFQITRNGEIVEETKYFNTKNSVILPTTDLNDWFNENMTDRLLTKVEEFQDKDSGWRIISVLNLMININQYDPLRGGLSTYVDLPDWIKKKKAVVNIQNFHDEYCFLWSVTAALRPVKQNSCLTGSYPHFSSVLKYDGIQFPISLKDDIPKFEAMNNLRINVYGLESGSVVPIYLSKQNFTKTIHLLAVNRKSNDNEFDDDDDEPALHFAWIRKLSQLVSFQVKNRHGAIHLCDRCLCHFKVKSSFEKHLQDCRNNNQVRMILPEENHNILKFKNYRFKEPKPFVIYADLECILAPQENGNEKHIPHSAAYYFHCTYDNSLSTFKLYRGEDCVEWFVRELQHWTMVIDNIMEHPVAMKPLSAQQQCGFSAATHCHICEQPFAMDEKRVKDHCHFTGRYRGPAHDGCNLNYKYYQVLPIVFHNLSGYDSHFFIKPLANLFKGQINLLPINKEKYISFTKKVQYAHLKKNGYIKYRNINLRFIDSFRFMATSLDKLASNLSDDDKVITKHHCNDLQKFELLKRKGVFPYEYVNNWEKLNVTQLPPQKDFFSKLNNSSISNDDYEHAKRVWNEFNIETLGEYSDLYLKTDVLLLADIFENFRKNCLSSYNLDPLHYYTTPGFSWDCMLKYTGVELELLTDPEQLLFIEKGIRGGVAVCPNRYAKANNKYMGSEYNQNKPDCYLMYLDVNNLYGTAMSQNLPCGKFEWDTGNWTDKNKILSITDNSPIGYIFEVDLEYPKELHESHKDFPLCPEHRAPPNSKQKKLMNTFFPKEKYVIHYRNLKQYLQLGMKLINVHRVLKFKQSTWLKSYIDLNTKKRQQAKNQFEKDYFKLLNNAISGKCIENVRKQKDVRMFTQWDGQWGLKRCIQKPNFHSCTIFDEDIAIVEMKRTQVTFNKPVYVGFSILDIAKTYVYEFHYDFIKETLRDCAKLLYHDTDSLLYSFINFDIYEHMKKNLQRFDTSDYPETNIFNIPQCNKKVLGLMKDENNGKIMTEFIGLRAKLYAYKILGEEKENKKAKGVKGSTLKQIQFNDYKKCLFQHECLTKTQYLIRSKKHQVNTVAQEKIVLSWLDDKRVLLPKTTDTAPWGYEINKD